MPYRQGKRVRFPVHGVPGDKKTDKKFLSNKLKFVKHEKVLQLA